MINHSVRADQHEKQKIKFEHVLGRSFSSLINKMALEIRKFIRDNGYAPSFGKYNTLLQNILEKNYLKIQKFFSEDELNSLEHQLKKQLDAATKKQLDDDLAIIALLLARKRSALLLKTMQSQLQDIVLKNNIDKIGLDKLSADAVREWKVSTFGRLNSIISNTEVQFVSENTKDYSVNFSSPFLMANSQANKIEKQWFTVGDDKVRIVHREANLQKVLVSSKFIVGGEKLQYPGDPAGSPWNIINCRCSSLVIVG